MSVAQTNAAAVLQQHADEISSHQLISLLMDGMLERVGQAKACIAEGNEKDKVILMGKIIAIINGLRESLNLDEGGEIAFNLDMLYDYIAAKVENATSEDENDVLNEVAGLIHEIKAGWDEIQKEPITDLNQ